MYLLTTDDEVDLVELEAELAGEDLGGQRLAGPGRAGEQDVQALAERELVVEAPVVVDERCGSGRASQTSRSCVEPVGRQDDVVQVSPRRHLAREPGRAPSPDCARAAANSSALGRASLASARGLRGRARSTAPAISVGVNRKRPASASTVAAVAATPASASARFQHARRLGRARGAGT